MLNIFGKTLTVNQIVTYETLMTDNKALSIGQINQYYLIQLKI